jgi:hypothetical protein
VDRRCKNFSRDVVSISERPSRHLDAWDDQIFDGDGEVVALVLQGSPLSERRKIGAGSKPCQKASTPSEWVSRNVEMIQTISGRPVKKTPDLLEPIPLPPHHSAAAPFGRGAHMSASASAHRRSSAISSLDLAEPEAMTPFEMLSKSGLF